MECIEKRSLEKKRKNRKGNIGDEPWLGVAGLKAARVVTMAETEVVEQR